MMKDNNTAQPADQEIESIMNQAQVFASAWAFFLAGSSPEQAERERSNLRALLSKLRAEGVQAGEPFGRAEISFPMTVPGSRVYLAGPMTGIAEHNFPAFNAAAERLRGFGLDVVNPADHGVVEGMGWADYMRWDIVKLAGCHSVYVLPGWEKSKGASLEVSIARALGMLVFTVDGAALASAPVADLPALDDRASYSADYVRRAIAQDRAKRASAPVAKLPDVEPEPRTESDYPLTLGGHSAPVAGDAARACPTDAEIMRVVRDECPDFDHDGPSEESMIRIVRRVLAGE